MQSGTPRMMPKAIGASHSSNMIVLAPDEGGGVEKNGGADEVSPERPAPTWQHLDRPRAVRIAYSAKPREVFEHKTKENRERRERTLTVLRAGRSGGGTRIVEASRTPRTKAKLPPAKRGSFPPQPAPDY